MNLFPKVSKYQQWAGRKFGDWPIIRGCRSMKSVLFHVLWTKIQNMYMVFAGVFALNVNRENKFSSVACLFASAKHTLTHINAIMTMETWCAASSLILAQQWHHKMIHEWVKSCSRPSCAGAKGLKCEQCLIKSKKNRKKADKTIWTCSISFTTDHFSRAIKLMRAKTRHWTCSNYKRTSQPPAYTPRAQEVTRESRHW